jgi:putative ABC transport system permease protein
VGSALIDVNGLRTSIVGVVATAKLRVAQREVEPTVYLPFGQDYVPRMTMLMETGRVSGRQLRELHRRLTLVKGGRPERIIVTTLDRHLSRTSLAPERITTVLVGASAVVSLGLGLLGLYGVMSDATRRRRREFALRVALGARGRHVIGQVVAEGLRLVAAGAAIGAAAALVVARLIARVSPAADGISPGAWILAPLALLVAVGVASVLPARKALSADPLLLLREE